jgi:hypothetical protein
MSFERVHQSRSQSSQSSSSMSQFALRPFPVQEPKRPPTQEEIENEAFRQNKFEVLGLQLKEKYGTITPVEQERLGMLQAKMDNFWAQRMEWAKAQPNILEILIRNGQSDQANEAVAPVQAKLAIGQSNDHYEQEADQVAAHVVEQINHPPVSPAPKVQREVTSDEEELVVHQKEEAGQVPIQRKVENAIIYATYHDINYDLPPNEDNFAAKLRELAEGSDYDNFKGLKAALLQDMEEEAYRRVERKLAQVEDTNIDVGFIENDEVENLEATQQGAGVVARAMVTLLPPLANVLNILAEDTYRNGLQKAYDYISVEAARIGAGRVSARPREEEARGALATTNKDNGNMVFYKPFFQLERSRMEDTILHETIHAVLGTEDVAYSWQRIFTYLPIEKARTNPDSYVAEFRQILGNGNLPHPKSTESDLILVCRDTVEEEIGKAEAVVLWGKEAFRTVSSLLKPNSVLPLDATAETFRLHYAAKTDNRATLSSWASTIAMACSIAAPILAKPIRVVATTTEAGGDAFDDVEGKLRLTYRTDYEDMPLWFCAKVFQQYTEANVSLAKALVSVYRQHGGGLL